MSLPRSEIEALRAPVMSAFEEIKSSVPGVKVWDPLPILCPAEQCQPFHDGKPLFFDGDHLTYYANLLLLSGFVSFINAE